MTRLCIALLTVFVAGCGTGVVPPSAHDAGPALGDGGPHDGGGTLRDASDQGDAAIPAPRHTTFASCWDPQPPAITPGPTGRRGVDYSWGRPGTGALHSAGYTFAARYLSWDTTGKNLTPDEARQLIAAGIDVVSNWEYDGADPLNGRAQGVSDATEAQRQAAACGAPADRPIYFSVDIDATEAQQAAINAYFDGVASVIGRERTGAYGGYWVIRRLFDGNHITWGWQTYAWSGGMWDPRAQLRQTYNGVTVGGADCDQDTGVTSDFGQWGASGATTALRHRFFEGDFDGNGTSDVAFYFSADNNVWLGLSSGSAIHWTLAGADTTGYGNLIDVHHQTFTGDFDGNGTTDLGFYSSTDGHVWIGLSDGAHVTWSLWSNDTTSYGNLMEATHHLFAADIDGDGDTDLGFYSSSDGHVVFGTSDAHHFTWSLASDATTSYGNLLDANHRVCMGDYDGDGDVDLSFYGSADGHVWLGTSDAHHLTWSLASSDTAAYGNLLDASHHLFQGDFDGDGDIDLGLYGSSDGHVVFGTSAAGHFTWSLASDATTGYGNLYDAHHRMFQGDYDGDGDTDLALYGSGDGRVFFGITSAGHVTWSLASETIMYADLLAPTRRSFQGDFDGDHRQDLAFYDSGDSNWWLGHSDGTHLTWSNVSNTMTAGNLLQ